MKSNDIIVAAFPKSGVSYLGYLLTTARLHHNKMTLRPNFFNIDFLLIDESKMQKTEYVNVFNDGLGCFIKTHAVRDKVNAPSAIVLIREPFATLRSYYHFRRQFAGAKDTPRQFLEGPHGISAWLAWMASWTSGNASQSLHFVDYDRLVKDTRRELFEISEGLGAWWELDSIGEALRWATLDNMRGLEHDFAMHNPVYQKFNLEFIRPGDSREVEGFGEGLRSVVDSRCKGVYDSVLTQFAKACVEK
jgi:hypothetical protein